jgi:hypothetical protein
MRELPEVRSLWIGPELSTLERLTIRSFLANGHTFRLFVYDDVRGIPDGTLVSDASEILPRSCIFTYPGSGSYAGFANWFRYRLVLERGGWWVDLDTVCLRPLDFEANYVFSSEVHEGRPAIDLAVLKAPKGSDLCRHLCEVCASRDPLRLVWGETGPRLLGEAVRMFGLTRFVHAPTTFCPIDHTEWMAVLDPERRFDFGPEVVAVHLWNAKWARYGRDKDASFHPGCLYEQLKSRYLGRAAGAL